MQNRWAPQIGPQTAAAGCPVDFTFFGGSRGGGKSDCLIGRQLRGSERWDKRWNGLVLRRKYKDFAEIRRRFDELITDGLEAARTGGEQQTNYIKFENGAKVTLAAIQNIEQVNDFVGHQYTEIAFDEATMFPWFIKLVDKLKGSNRSPHGVPCRMFGTGNPGGPGHLQVKDYFGLGTGGVPPETIIRTQLEGGYTETRIFIPSFLDNNKILCLNDPLYVARLKSISDPALKRAWILGDWDVFIGQAFQFSERYHVIDPQPIPLGAPIYMTFDWGYGKPFSLGWWWVDLEGRVYRFAEWYGASGIDEGLRINDPDIALGIKEREQKLGINDRQITRLAGPDCWNKKPDYRGGGQGPSTAEVFTQHGLFLIPGDANRSVKIRQFRSRLAYKLTDDGHIDQWPMMMIYRGCKDFIRTIPALVMSETDPEDIDTDMEDHCFAGETLVDTDHGQVAIKDMVGKHGKVLTAGGYWTDFNNCRMTMRHVDVVKIDFNNNRSIVCTPNHNFYTKTKGYIKAINLIDEECLVSISLNKPLMEAGIWRSKSSMSGHRDSTESNTIYAGNTFSESEQLVQNLVQQERHGEPVRVKSVKPYGKADVYCLNAADTHAFCVEGGILVHNCYDEACHIVMARPIKMVGPPSKQSSYDKRIDAIKQGPVDGYEREALKDQDLILRQLDNGMESNATEYDDGLRETT